MNALTTYIAVQSFGILISSAHASAASPGVQPLNSSASSVGSSQDAKTRQGWTASPNGRGTIDIIWNCAATMFLCSWAILCLNVAGPTDNPWRIFRRKLWLTALCFLGPEFLLQSSLGQWASARQSVRDFEGANIEGWTLSHAFFADMGGIVLHTRDGFPAFPVDSKQLLFLITHGFISKPNIGQDVIKDKNKVDGVLRLITLCQIFWFGINIAGRAIQGLAITCLELTTAAFIVCNIGTTYCWLHKPADVTTSEHIESPNTIQEIVEAAYKSVQEREHSDQRNDGTEPSRATHFYIRTPLEIISRREWHWSKYWSNWINIIRHCGFVFEPERRPVDRFENTVSMFLPEHLYWFCLFVSAVYAGLFALAWNFEFPTPIERMLWRAASLTIPCVALSYLLVTEWSFRVYPKMRERLRRTLGASPSTVEERKPLPRLWFGQKAYKSFHRVASAIRNNTVHKDPALDVPLKAILPMYVLGVFYCHARTFVFLEDIIELRSLPASAYQTVNWSAFFPHI